MLKGLMAMIPHNIYKFADIHKSLIFAHSIKLESFK